MGRDLEFLGGHVGRIVVRPGGLRPYARQERAVVVEAVPRAVVDLGKPAGVGIFDAFEKRFAVAVCLLPEQTVHHLSGLNEQGQHLALGI